MVVGQFGSSATAGAESPERTWGDPKRIRTTPAALPGGGGVRLRASSMPAIIPSLLTLREGGKVSPPTHDHGRFEFDDKAKDAGSTAFRTVRNVLAIIGLLFIIALILLAVGVYKLAT